MLSRSSLARSAAGRLAALVIALAALAPVAGAQRPDSLRVDTTAFPEDSVPRLERLGAPAAGARPPISTRKAFLYSVLAPGLGQARLDRPNGGALFAGIEMGAIFMAFKSRDDLRFAERAARRPSVTAWRVGTDGRPVLDDQGNYVPADTVADRYATRVKARRVHYEDWIAVLVFNHLFAGVDALVAAQLWDMPVRGSVRAIGPRDAMVGARVEFGGGRSR